MTSSQVSVRVACPDKRGGAGSAGPGHWSFSCENGPSGDDLGTWGGGVPPCLAFGAGAGSVPTPSSGLRSTKHSHRHPGFTKRFLLCRSYRYAGAWLHPSPYRKSELNENYKLIKRWAFLLAYIQTDLTVSKSFPFQDEVSVALSSNKLGKRPQMGHMSTIQQLSFESQRAWFCPPPVPLFLFPAWTSFTPFKPPPLLYYPIVLMQADRQTDTKLKLIVLSCLCWNVLKPQL